MYPHPHYQQHQPQPDQIYPSYQQTQQPSGQYYQLPYQQTQYNPNYNNNSYYYGAAAPAVTTIPRSPQAPVENQYPTLDALDVSGEHVYNNVTPPSIQAVTRAVYSSSTPVTQPNSSADYTTVPSHLFLTPHSSAASSSSIQTQPNRASTDDKSAFGKVASTLGTKLSELTKLSFNMAKIKLNSIGGFITTSEDRNSARPPQFGFVPELRTLVGPNILFSDKIFEQLFYLFRSICRGFVSSRPTVSSDDDVLCASLDELLEFVSPHSTRDIALWAISLLLPPDADTSSAILLDFLSFITRLNALIFGPPEVQLERLYLAFKLRNVGEVTRSAILASANHLLISNMEHFTSVVKGNMLYDDCLSLKDFVSLLAPVIAEIGIFKFVNDTFVGTCSDKLHIGSNGEAPSYRHKEGFLLKHYGSVMDKWFMHWCSLENGIFTYYKDVESYSSPGRSIAVVNAKIERISVAEKNTDLAFKITVGDLSRKFIAHSEEDLQDWMDAFESHASHKNRFESSFPIRDASLGEAYVDGAEGFMAIYEALMSAKESIYIADWFFSPETYLYRPKGQPLNESYRLDIILKRKADAGVKICILVWNETKIVTPLNSENVQMKMQGLNKHNIFVQRHPLNYPVKWSHHQKIVVVDQDIAFVGGLDLCFGRYDDHNHFITDPDAKMWPGKDYYNPVFCGFEDVHNFGEDSIDRQRHPRMAWHDIHVRLSGHAARDVARNFMERWNFAKEVLERISTPYLEPKLTLPPGYGCGTLKCQVIRSIGSWHLRNFLEPESSIYRAYLDLIAQAKHFIYIENQFFISSLAGHPVVNQVALALLNRIRSAIQTKSVFRVVVVLPVHPDGTLKDDAGIRYLMKWQYSTINRGENSILATLSREFPNVDLSQYITFNALRKAEFIFGSQWGNAVTEQIYVHSKLMIVDDRIALIGSANINDRSFDGTRDSEIGVVIEDQEMVPSTMNGQSVLVGRFAHELRKKLWREHLGLTILNESINDPILSSVWNDTWLRTARNNSQIFLQVFPLAPGDRIASLKEMDDQKLTDATAAQQLLYGVRGHLIEFPLNFLRDTTLDPMLSDINIQLADTDIFT